jgi:hypothetical protein
MGQRHAQGPHRAVGDIGLPQEGVALAGSEVFGLVVTPVPKVPFWKLSNFNESQPTFSTTY